MLALSTVVALALRVFYRYQVRYRTNVVLHAGMCVQALSAIRCFLFPKLHAIGILGNGWKALSLVMVYYSSPVPLAF